MATTNNLKKGLNRKLWEMCNNAPSTATAGTQIISSYHFRQQQLYVSSATTQFLYLPEEDGYIQIPNAGFAGTFGAGTAGASGCVGIIGTATAGTPTTLTTNQTILRDLRGYKIHITSGAGAGDIVDILSNTIGANSVITANFSTTINNTSVYRLLTPRWYFVNGGTQSVGTVKMYCYALNTWSNLATTNLPSNITNGSRMISTPSIVDGAFQNFASGTATAATTNTLSNSAKAWTTNQWTNSQVRITAGTGNGQVRTISSNTGTQLTVSVNWTTIPDATSQYVIEGNDDYLYFVTFAANSVYRYSISGNSWTVLASRASAMASGASLHWIHNVNDSAWTNENSIINGRRLYSFRGNSTTTLDYYDIPSNTWTNDVSYAPKTEALSTGSQFIYKNNFIYIQFNNSGRFFKFDLVKSAMDGFHVLAYPQTTALDGDRLFDFTYKDGATEVVFLYYIIQNSNIVFRTLVI